VAEGDLICGSNNSQIATLVERHTRYVMLVRVPSKDTKTVINALIKHAHKLLQNMRHVRAVQGLLDFLPPGAIKSVVVVTGEAEFKTEIPQGVFSISGLIDYLRDQTDEVMSLNRVLFCVGRLETARLAISGETDVEHVQSLERRHGGATT